MDFAGSACIVISQSGSSPDLLAVATAAKQGGAHVIALLNAPDSPLAKIANDVLPLHAGKENSIAATKSFIASLSALLHLLAAWQEDSELEQALSACPGQLRDAWSCDWDAALDPLCNARNLFVLGRGIGLGIAEEAALKFKEVCGLHAEAYSAAEVLHGPVAIAGRAFPVLVFAQRDRTLQGIETLVGELASRGITVIAAGTRHDKAINLPTPASHAAIEPLLRVQSFYRMANDLALRLKLDPDRPPYLQKVTITV
jgi:glucosamine--fructose-6-phosphate aminotransferase (isomerizing)